LSAQDVSSARLRRGLSAFLARHRLACHLAVVLLLKIILLRVLWLNYVAPYRVAVDEQRMAQQLTGSTKQPIREVHHDRFDGR